MEGADDVLRARQVDRRLAADSRVDLADERRRDGRPGDAAHVRRGGEPGDVGRRAAAERDDAAVAADREAAPEPLEHGGGLRRLAGGHLVDARRPGRRADLGADAVDPRDVRVGDELDGAVARDEVAELVDRPGLDVDPGGGEQDPVDVARVGVRDLLVERLPLAVERVERARSTARAGGRSPSTRCQAVSGSTSSSTVKARAARSRRVRSERTAPPPSATTAARRGEHVLRDVLLDRAEAGLAACHEQLGDRRPGAGLDLAGRGRRTAARVARRRDARRASCPSP